MPPYKIQVKIAYFTTLLLMLIPISLLNFSFIAEIIYCLILGLTFNAYISLLEKPYKNFPVKIGDTILVDYMGTKVHAQVLNISVNGVMRIDETLKDFIDNSNSEDEVGKILQNYEIENVLVYECKLPWRDTPFYTSKVYLEKDFEKEEQQNGNK